MGIRAIFIDRDGTINAEKGYVHRPEEFEYLPGVIAALERLSRAGVQVFVVTNQAGIAKGLYTEADFAALTDWMLQDMSAHGVRIEEVLYCPHHPEGTVGRYRQECECRKPGTALLEEVMRERQLAPAEMAIIGDKNSDIEAGRRLGIRTYLVETGYGAQEKRTTRADYIVPDLPAAVEHLLAESDEYESRAASAAVRR